MEEQSTSFLTQPFTFGGVAAFARASFGRLALFQIAVALFAAGVVAIFFEFAWVPVLKRAIEALPRTGDIQNRTLNWGQASPLRSAGSSFLWISVDPADSLEPGEGADVQLEFRKAELRIRSLLGYCSVPYPDGWVIALNRAELEPWWGAWHPGITLGLGVSVFLGLFLIWTAIALAYLWPVRLIGFYADRKLSLGGAWRMAAASLLPGATFLTLAILAYTVHRINLVQLLLALVLHVMIGWAYVLAAPFCLPRQSAPGGGPPAKNPFGPPTGKPNNPFADPK